MCPYKSIIEKRKASKRYYNKHKEKILLKHKEYREKHHKWFIEYARNYRIENKEKDILWRKHNKERIKLLSKKSRDKYKDRQHQRYIINRLFKKDSKCFNCGNSNNLEFHHINYNNNHVVTLCMRCHKQLHRKY